MRRVCFLVGAVVLGVFLSVQAGYRKAELLYEENFNVPAEMIKGWNVPIGRVYDPGGGKEGKGALYFSSPEDRPGGIMIQKSLNPKVVNGRICLEATVRGRNLKPACRRYWGSKIMLSFRGIRGDIANPEPQRRFGTYDWYNAVVFTDVGNPESIKLSLGMQKGTGEFWVQSVRIYRVEEGVDSTPPPESNPVADALPRGKGGTRYRGFMSGEDMSEEAFRQLAEWNVNLIRYQFLTKRYRNGRLIRQWDVSTQELYLKWIDDQIRELDAVLPLCRKYGIRIAIDVHVGPGTKIDHLASNTLGGDTNVETLEKAWRRIAQHYRNEPLIYGYDLLNEPKVDKLIRTDRENPWLIIANRVVKAIREVDRTTPVICSLHSGCYIPLDDGNVIYSPHFYSPLAYTHYGILDSMKWDYPGWIDGVYWNKEQMRAALKNVIEFQRKYGVPIYIGEFSVVNWAANGERWLADAIELFEEYGWDWTYHAFREAPTWSLEHQGWAPRKFKRSSDNPRLRVIKESLHKNAKPAIPLRNTILSGKQKLTEIPLRGRK